MSSFKTTALLLMGAMLLLPGFSFAQEHLTLEQAIRIGLERNYDIRIVNREQQIVENNTTLGNSGFLPTVNGRLAQDYSQNDLRNQFENNEPRIVEDSRTDNRNASVQLNWDIFDGGRMFINLNRFRLIARSGALFNKATVETTLATILNSYYDVVRQSRKINSIEDAITISELRVKITEEQYNVGVSAKVEILRAQVDYNADRSELLSQLEILQNAKINLNQLLGRSPDIDFTVDDAISIDPDIRVNAANNEAIVNNPNLQRLQLERDIAIQDVRLARSLRLPTVGVTGSYGYNRSLQEPVIFGNTVGTNESRRIGFNYGAVLTLPIFNGFEIRRQIQNSAVLLESSTLALEQEQNRLQSDLARAYTRYRNRLELLELEESNLNLARENADIALERYRLGLLTAIELREAQRNQLVAENRLIDIQYEAKAAETELKRISSTLLSESTM